MKRRFNTFLALTLLFFAMLSVGCATDKAVISQAQQFDSQLKPAEINDPQLSDYLQRVGDRIIASARELDRQGFGPASHKKESSEWMFGQNMKFHFVNSKTLNAFTTGGDHMYIYNELFQQCKTEDELAAVMAHEYGHVYARHVQKGMNRQMGFMGVGALAGLAGYLVGGKESGQQYAGTAAGAATALAQVGGMYYTRGDEAEADHLGFNFYTRAGWDPNRFGDFFQHMIDLGYDKGPEFLSDHPMLSTRVAAAKKEVAALPPAAAEWKKPPVADAAQFRQLQGRAQQLAATTPDDKSLQNTQALLAALPRSCLTPSIPPDQKRAQQQIIEEAKREKQAKKK